MSKSYTSENGFLTLNLEESEDTVLVRWSGRSTSLYPYDFLKPIFNDVLAFNKKIVMNFVKVDLVTSSTLTPLVELLEIIKNGDWQIELQFDSGIEWQELTFSALAVFSQCDRIHLNGI